MTTKKEFLNSLPAATRSSITSSKIQNHNTFVTKYENGDTGVWFHKTEIYRELKNGDVVIACGGYFTATTKERLHDLMEHCRLHQEKGIWWLTASEHDYRVQFVDGMTLPGGRLPPLPVILWRKWMPDEEHVWMIDHNGETLEVDDKINGNWTQTYAEKLAKKDKTSLVIYPYGRPADLVKQITKFSHMIELGDPHEAMPVPVPEPGDCWICKMGPNVDCLWSHIHEKYMHGSLIMAALKHQKESDYVIGSIFSGVTRFNNYARRAVVALLKEKLGVAR